MAHVDVNTALGAVHGKMDGYVYRKQGDKTLIYRLPESTKPVSAARHKTICTFGDASQWARTGGW